MAQAEELREEQSGGATDRYGKNTEIPEQIVGPQIVGPHHRA
eukprot:CAMPEP_0172776826 /NCGR_PEP_ID=MMETSP1074-20121228/200629_1 /TAXON_ID=2916 /ORGANISM="Ceratium fusus, Strain PA161109" /LENGTH=41 /DNA_ID= /DNA_START= /DNA_END= /DNA_ORIENTATION=